MAEIKVRGLTSLDLLGLAKLEQAACAKPLRLQDLEDLRTGSSRHVFVAEFRKSLLGYSVLHCPEDDATLILSRLAVLPVYRRQGVGRLLIQKALSLAGDRPLQTRVGDSQTALHLFLRAVGFQYSRVERRYDQKEIRGEDQYLFSTQPWPQEAAKCPQLTAP